MPGRVKELVSRIDSNAKMAQQSNKSPPSPKPEPTPEPTPELGSDTKSDSTTDAKPDTEINDNPRTTVDDTTIEGSFASKDTPRVSSVMADGIAFIRELAEKLVEETKIADKAPIIILAIRLAEWAESRLRAFTGTEKKKMVLNLLLWAVENQEDVLFNILGDNEDELYRLVRDVIPSVLDLVCAASKGELKLNHVIKATNGCLGWCFGNKKA